MPKGTRPFKSMVLGTAVLLVMLLAVDLGKGQAQEFRRGGRDFYESIKPPEKFPSNQFIFCRVKYTSYPGGGFGGMDRWRIDYPESDQHFSWRISQLTTLKVPKDKNGEYKHAVVRLTDKELFDYPFIYMLEVGYLIFDEVEVENLRKYLLRGGFLMVDDFWGEREWANWEAQIYRVLDPLEYRYEKLKLDHPIFNCVFEIKEFPQVPAPQHWLNWGRTYEREDAKEANYWGIYDKEDRLMVVVCHNTDLGDGWEREGINKEYFEELSVKKAYPMGINIVVYALTH
jgi:hypothetical protein